MMPMRAGWAGRAALLAAVTAVACGGGEPPGTNPGSKEKGQAEFEAVRASFGVLETLAGAGQRQEDVNEWNPSFEGGPAVAAELSSPHNALGDDGGNVFIADKEAHAIRKVTTDGRIVTVAGVNAPGDDGDTPGDGAALHLDGPNGIWVARSGIVYILDLVNAKVRRLDRGGQMTTLFTAVTLGGGRGLWVADDESLAYASASGDLLRWTPAAGVTMFATGFLDLGNLVTDDAGAVYVTDRGQNKVFRVGTDGAITLLAGTGDSGVAQDGTPALETPLDEVRGIWRHPAGGFLLGTHHGNRVFYLDSQGYTHILIDGARGQHAGDGQPLTVPGYKVSEVRNVAMTPAGDLLITEHDAGYVRIARRAP
jgi:DNA-binding beta-propeller fold protein YncE